MATESSMWFIETVEDEGKPLILRIREAAPSYATKETYPMLLAVTWAFDPEANNGMPLPDDVERMQQLEHVLEPVIADARQAFLTVVVTGNVCANGNGTPKTLPQ